MNINPLGGAIPGYAPFGSGAGFNLPGSFPLAGASNVDSASEVSGAGAVTGAGSFASVLSSKLGELDQLHKTSDDLAVKALTGDLTDVHQYTIASQEAQIATQLAVSVRNKAVDAFTEIMRMPL